MRRRTYVPGDADEERRRRQRAFWLDIKRVLLWIVYTTTPAGMHWITVLVGS